MGFFSRSKQERRPHEVLIENAMFTILRDARREAPGRVASGGAEEYVRGCLDRLLSVTAVIPYPLENVEFRVLRDSKRQRGDVVFYVRVSGNSNIFAHIGQLYRLQGSLGTDGPHLVTLHYRESQYIGAQNLNELFCSDVEVLRMYLSEVARAIELRRSELRKLLNEVLHQTKDYVDTTGDLVKELHGFGFKPRE